jgi:uncharacterized protein
MSIVGPARGRCALRASRRAGWALSLLVCVGCVREQAKPTTAHGGRAQPEAAVDARRPVSEPVSRVPVDTWSDPSGGYPQQGLALLELTVGLAPIAAEVAATGLQRQIGLMHRLALAPGRGMLFIYPDRAQRAFWMKNTLVPLSIAYIADDGTITEIVDMEPAGEGEPPTYPSRAAVRFALEVNKGWFERNNIAPGDLVLGLEHAPEGR